MSNSSLDSLLSFAWERHPAAWALVSSGTQQLCERSAFLASFAGRLTTESGTRLVDWIDHLALGGSDASSADLEAVGYERDPSDAKHTVYRHPGGVFPAILLSDTPISEIVLKVDSVEDFARIHGIDRAANGEPLSIYRTLHVADDNGVRLSVAERHGYRGFGRPAFSPALAAGRVRHREAFETRQRDFADDAAGFAHAMSLIDAAMNDGLSASVVCDAFFAAERTFWMRRNRAAQVQYARQQRLGMGWANHDHHTYRSSRANFTRLVAVWEKLGFAIRERFYAGAQAGWGAQVMEQVEAGIITFNDVDLSPDELVTDFAHEPLRPQPKLGTVGMWCGLHGDSFLQAGMHHLECQFDFDALRQQLESEYAVKVMKPFTDYPHLRQAFTEGERWPVAPERIDRLLKQGLITPEQAEQFRANGAIGSHLENLERNDGFKGFNQTGVSEIIAATDPRLHLATK